MKNLIKFILFLMYTIGIFFVDNYIAILGIIIVNILLMLIAKINITNAVKNLINLLPFIVFTSAINILLVDFKFAVLIGIRLLIVCNVTYTFSKTISYTEFSKVIEKIVYPLKIFKINPKDVGIIVTIALSFLPIIKNELQETKRTLEVKGVRSSNINLLKNINIIFKPFFVAILQRLNEIELTLRVKGYQE